MSIPTLYPTLPCPRRAGLTQSALLLYNNVLALPLMLGMLLTSSELPRAWHYPRLRDPRFQVLPGARLRRGAACARVT